jgi:amino acid transporter
MAGSMAQKATAQTTAEHTPEEQRKAEKGHLGPILCWAVVFADIGTSLYYVPGILYNTVGKLAGFFVLLTMVVFVLLTLKYSEVTYRFPQGGGVVTVASQAINRWFGALGGMLILVDYFLTAAISGLSGILYVSVVVTVINPQHALLGLSTTLWITIVVLILLGFLNWIGISESARVSLVGAIIAFVSDVAILFTVFSHVSITQFLGFFPQMLKGHALTPISTLTGFAGAFLAFSGLESISQISPEMKIPRKVVGRIALFLVIATVGLTSPLITMLSTLLLPNAAADPVRSAQIVSLLAGHWGNNFLQTEVAISAGALLVFASNTAIIGSYHVFIALSRMEFFPELLLQRNRLRNTPHYAILIATVIPILVLLLVRGNINILGDMYAFGLLGAFTLTCISMDIVRYRQRKTGWQPSTSPDPQSADEAKEQAHEQPVAKLAASAEQPNSEDLKPEPEGRWTRSRANFWLGILTTLLVSLAWCTNLVSKPLATAFGGTLAAVGMGIAYLHYSHQKKKGRRPVVTTGGHTQLPAEVLAILAFNDPGNMAVAQSAIKHAKQREIVFLYLGNQSSQRKPDLFEITSPYLHDKQAREDLALVNHLAHEANVSCKFVYRHKMPGAVRRIWQELHPLDTICTPQQEHELKDIPANQVSYEQTQDGTIVHYQLK